MAKKNTFHKDFSNKKTFNNVPCQSDEELIPVILSNDMRVTLTFAGLDENNVENWRLPHTKEIVPVVYIPTKKGHIDEYMIWFNSEIDIHIKLKSIPAFDTLSLDAFLEKFNENDNLFDPTATTENEDTTLLNITFNMLLHELSQQDENMGKIIKLLSEGYSKQEIISMIDLTEDKTQAYSYIKNTQKLAHKLYNKKYR
ncbi:MAG: hypothetical protein R3Y54_09705 [Eubacteriales bacterium]